MSTEGRETLTTHSYRSRKRRNWNGPAFRAEVGLGWRQEKDESEHNDD
jgi:hypothetical protein